MVTKDMNFESLNRKEPEGLNKHGNPFRVLVVDDSSTMRKIVSQQLRAEAYEVCAEAENGQEAVQKYREADPDVVTMDINMPVMDGIEALAAIMEIDPKARVVMLTSEGQKQMVLNAITIGAKGYVVKPPKKAAVCEKVRQALGA